MSDNYNQATISPSLPASLFSEDELETLSIACGLSCETCREHIYLFADSSFSEEGDDEEGENVDLLALLQAKLRQLDAVEYPHITIHGASTCSKMREDEFGGFAHVITRENVRSVSTWSWLAQQTRQCTVSTDPVEACRMVVERWEHGDLAEAARACGDAVAHVDGDTSHASGTGTITIEVRGGVVQEVSNLPPGWNYELVDYDDLDSENR
jgi:hypothetical protein